MADLPLLADKQMLTVGEVVRAVAVAPHTLRYWERKLPELSALIERRGNRRYYPAACVALLSQIKTLVAEGQTLRGVRKTLLVPAAVAAAADVADGGDDDAADFPTDDAVTVAYLRRQIQEIIDIL